MIPLQRRGHPAWCVTEHTNGGGTKHRSKPVQVGSAATGGTVRAWLVQHGTDTPCVTLNASYMTGLSIDLPVAEVAQFIPALTELLNQAPGR